MASEPPAHHNRKTPCSQQSRWSSPRTPEVFSLLALALLLHSGCGALGLHELTGRDDIDVRLDSNSKVHMPGRTIKFYVDLVNQTRTDVDVRGIKIELQASPGTSPDIISLRHTWRYRWKVESPPLRPGKRMTIPVVPERGVEFPLEMLRPGSYNIVAVVNDRFISGPYPLEVVRPDLMSGVSGTSRRSPAGSTR